MMTTRERIAKLLGFAHWADYFAADQMIGNGTGIGSFIAALDAAARAPAEREFQMLLAEKRKADPEATGLSVDETSYYSELLRRAAYDFDSQSVRPYFPYERVKQGIIDTAAALFHVNIEREANVPVWDPSVESWLVREQGRVIGRIYLDMHPREGKFSGNDEALGFSRVHSELGAPDTDSDALNPTCNRLPDGVGGFLR